VNSRVAQNCNKTPAIRPMPANVHLLLQSLSIKQYPSINQWQACSKRLNTNFSQTTCWCGRLLLLKHTLHHHRLTNYRRFSHTEMNTYEAYKVETVSWIQSCSQTHQETQQSRYNYIRWTDNIQTRIIYEPEIRSVERGIRSITTSTMNELFL